jgi:hypothetical protein
MDGPGTLAGEFFSSLSDAVGAKKRARIVMNGRDVNEGLLLRARPFCPPATEWRKHVALVTRPGFGVEADRKAPEGRKQRLINVFLFK